MSTPETIGTLASFFGGDELARRGMVAQGKTPGEEFALTPERADEIAGIDNSAALARALGVAEINNRDDVPVANIHAGASRYGADKRASVSRYSADASAAASRYAAEQRAEAKRVAAECRAAEREEARRAAPISAPAYTKLAKVIEKQLDELGPQSPPSKGGKSGDSDLDAGVHTWIRTRAIENFRQSGNFDDAAARAIRAAVVASKRQRAARTRAEASGPSSPARVARGKQYSVPEAAKLPKSTRFIGTDGIERVRQ